MKEQIYPQQISKDQIVLLCAKSLRYYDERLVDHGERVAYLARGIYRELSDQQGMDLKTLMILCLFHDIGAYKTEEIDQMVAFETGPVWQHSIFGYLFLNNFSPLGEISEAILYHHLSREKHHQVDSAYLDYAALIRLADRIDILMGAGVPVEAILPKLHTKHFCLRQVQAFEKAVQKPEFISRILSGDYQQTITDQVSEFDISPLESLQYLKMLVHSIDFKSELTVVHSVNTMEISIYLAQQLQMPRAELEKIYFAALIHDLGKMAIPEKILEFPGKLNAPQMGVMRTHVEITGEIVKWILPEDICKIAVRHHEKLNGSGYPLGLTAEELSTSDRIVAIADILSALISRRSYKTGYDKEKTIRILRKMGSSGELDPIIVQIVIDQYDRLLLTIAEKAAPVLEGYHRMQQQYQELMIRLDVL